MQDPPPFDEIASAGRPSMLLLCDHATNHVPEAVNGGTLGLNAADMARHIAYDIGAQGVTVALAETLGEPALLSRFSRLVIDPNRGEDDPTLIMQLYDGTIVPANRMVDAAERQRRLDAYHRPYHAAIDAAIDRMTAGEAPPPALIAIHSFTPQLRGRAPRPWHVGVLWHHDDRLARPLITGLSAWPGLCVGANEPYSGQLEGDTLSRHGTRRGLAHVLIELRHDLIATQADQGLWARRLAPILAEAVAAAHAKEEPDGS